MNYKNTLSALFYMIEATKYLPEGHKDRLDHQVFEVLEDAYRETNILSFKLFVEMKRAFQSTHLYDAKRSLQKTNTSMYVTFDVNPTQLPGFIRTNYNEEDIDYTEEMDALRGSVSIRVRHSDYNSGRLSVHVNFLKCKDFSEVEFQKVVHRINQLRGAA